MSKKYGSLIIMIVLSTLFFKLHGVFGLLWPHLLWRALFILPGLLILGGIAVWIARDAKNSNFSNPVLWGLLVFVTPACILLYFAVNILQKMEKETDHR